MTQAQHTPGPWFILEKDYYEIGQGRRLAIYSHEPSVVDKKRTYITEVPYAKTANAQLIAAAPDMLEALQEIQKAYGQTEGAALALAHAIKKAIAAIKKAKGEL